MTGGPEPGTVQHCNSATGYEMIVHPYAPDECDHCAEIAQIKVVTYQAPLATGRCQHCGQRVLFNLAIGHVQHETPNEACSNPWPAS
ncbi:hypothetical protein ABT023_16295 [Micromonospora sp. NPDC002296]|uniref:hypothetical protein n=1 Tax=Micromonospora sp. NPDC002296 TaxID=3154271 RepID=UPI00331B63F5